MRKISYIFFISKNNNNNVYNIELKKIAFKNNILKYIFVIIFKIYSKIADINTFFFVICCNRTYKECKKQLKNALLSAKLIKF